MAGDPLNRLMTMLMSGDVPSSFFEGRRRVVEGGNRGTGRTPPGIPREDGVLNGPLLPPMALGQSLMSQQGPRFVSREAAMGTKYLKDIMDKTGASKLLGERASELLQNLWAASYSIEARAILPHMMRHKKTRELLEKQTGPSRLDNPTILKKYMGR